MDFSRDGPQIVAGSKDKTAKVWDIVRQIDSGDELGTPKRSNRLIRSQPYAPNVVYTKRPTRGREIE